MALTQQQAGQALQQAGVNVFNLQIDGNGVRGQVASDAERTKAMAALTAAAGGPVGNFLEVQSNATAGAASAQSYTVKSGDTLSKIAKHFYGDVAQWKKIHEANKAAVPNPDMIQVGQTLSIPAA
jgi:nucleoid-associated protein YgaU